ncbi:Uncharacterized protein BM_BM17994 [Brugia malayi]|uniref:Uncharacterized protein n=1 Tax=Brugia malayi TaxID=6279 RepID=A0A4E9EX04_BRUMA|nr:Uncharacterized protein BM_BM17994 [Brugia malayi]VIO88246.1 Uncharacterized protein BM_BM17994 [Brugia malayi]
MNWKGEMPRKKWRKTPHLRSQNLMKRQSTEEPVESVCEFVLKTKTVLAIQESLATATPDEFHLGISGVAPKELQVPQAEPYTMVPRTKK